MINQFKRLNVITSFESEVDNALRTADIYELSFSGRNNPNYSGVFGVLVKKPLDLNEAEIKYVTDNYNRRKTFVSRFISVAEINAGKNLGRFSSFKETFIRLLNSQENVKETDVYFAVLRSNF